MLKVFSIDLELIIDVGKNWNVHCFHVLLNMNRTLGVSPFCKFSLDLGEPPKPCADATP